MILLETEVNTAYKTLHKPTLSILNHMDGNVAKQS